MLVSEVCVCLCVRVCDCVGDVLKRQPKYLNGKPRFRGKSALWIGPWLPMMGAPSHTLRFRFLSLESSFFQHIYVDLTFYHAAVTEPLVCDLIVVEVNSPSAKLVPVQSYNSFLDQRSRKVVV